MPGRQRWRKKQPQSKLSRAETFLFYIWLQDTGHMDHYLGCKPAQRIELEETYKEHIVDGNVS